jgi:prenyltransferase beta subunit
MRRDADFFGEAELDLIYMARRLRDALKVEDLLTAAGIDYLVETGTYTGGFLMKRDLAGAFFYVTPAQLTGARDLLLRNHYKPYQGEN